MTESHGMESAMERILVKCHMLDGWRREARIWWREGCEWGATAASACLPERVWVKRSSKGRRILKAESVRNTSG